MRGWAPAWSRMSTVPTTALAPASSASLRPSVPPASVMAVRLWLVSKWKSSRTGAPDPNALTISRTASRLRPSDTFGTASSTPLHEQLAGAHDRLAVERDLGLGDHAVQVHRHLARPADPGRGAERDVGGAEDLLVLEHLAGQDRFLVRADAELGDACRLRPVLGEQLHEPHARGARRVGEPTRLDRQRH